MCVCVFFYSAWTLCVTLRVHQKDVVCCCCCCASVQSRLLELDDECVKEQLKIQRKFAARMRPLMLERQSVMDKIPNFWGRVMSNLPLDEDHILCSEDAELLSVRYFSTTNHEMHCYTLSRVRRIGASNG